MLSSMRSVDYSDKTECLPAFIAVAMTILTYNIANGMALSIVSYLILKLAAGKGKEVPKSMLCHRRVHAFLSLYADLNRKDRFQTFLLLRAA